MIRPVGGALADRFRGSVVTFYNFIAMAVGASIVLVAAQLRSLPVYIIGFVLLFVFSGIGNGSTYKMIPSIFHAKAQLDVGAGEDVVAADLRAIRRAGALIGLAGAIGALGGVVVNLAFRQSFLTLKNGDGAYSPSSSSTPSASRSPGRCSSGPARAASKGSEPRRPCLGPVRG